VDDEGRDVQVGQPGEAWLRGPIITQGYHNNPEADQKAFHKGWYRTGDLIEIRDDLIYVKGRLKVCHNFPKIGGISVANAPCRKLFVTTTGMWHHQISRG
jgi:acyl-CoA synthetase (AMP-forming)/AMP-acid ligase II